MDGRKLNPGWELLPVRALMLCLLMLLSGQGLAHLESTQLSLVDSGRSLNADIHILQDHGAQLSAADLHNPEIQTLFTPAHGLASVGQSRDPWWIRVSLSAAADQPKKWWLEVGSVTPHDIRLYLPTANGQWQERRSGESIGFAQGRDVDYRRIVFELPELSEQPLTFYLRSFDPAGNSFPLKVWQLDDLRSAASLENMLFGLLYGCLAAMLLYNLFVFLSLRDAAYFWYVLTTAAALALIMAMNGHAQQYLWPQPVPVWLDRIVLPAFWGFTACRFTQVLLQTRQYAPIAHLLLNLACGIYLLTGALDFIDLRPVSAKLFIALTLLGIPVSLYAAIKRWHQGYTPALFYLGGYGMILIGSAVLMLRATGVLQPTAWNSYFYPVMIGVESILFALALAHRIHLLKQEKEDALRRAEQEKNARLELMHNNAIELQKAVDERTAELAEANRRLSAREQELKTAAFHDPLTDLPNRRYLGERARTALADASRRNESVALLLIDLDHFKPVNDTYGHDAGDLMLKTIGIRLREQVRAGDMVARLGGDEFAILVCGADALQHAQEIANRLLQTLTQPVLYGQQQLCISVSIGAALFPQHARQFISLYKAADNALYLAKEAGRNGFRLHDGRLPELNFDVTLDVLKVPSGLIASQFE